MTRDELVLKVQQALYNADMKSDPILVDFTIDEIYWNEIAKLAVDIVLKEEVDVIR